MTYPNDAFPPQSRTRRFGQWLARRPAESWMFFAAGAFLGGLFF